MTDPENWPLWLKLLTFPPLALGGWSMWVPLSKIPEWRRLQIACMVYLCLFAIFFAWKQPLIGFAAIGIGAITLIVFLYLRRQNSN
jgi:amino acid permease